MSLKVVILQSAQTDLKELRTYLIKQFSSQTWQSTYADLKTAILGLADLPYSGSIPEEIEKLNLGQYRQIISGMNRSHSNDELVDLRDSDLILEEPMPPDIPYAVLYAEDCPGEFCDRIRPVLEAAMADLAELNDLGTFVAVKGAGHEIFASDLEEVVAQITAVIRGA